MNAPNIYTRAVHADFSSARILECFRRLSARLQNIYVVGAK
jgi:hypothetical protein